MGEQLFGGREWIRNGRREEVEAWGNFGGGGKPDGAFPNSSVSLAKPQCGGGWEQRTGKEVL